MSVIVSVKSGNLSDTLKTYAEEKANTIVENYPKITSVRVILDTEKSRHKAEIIVRGKNVNIEADEETFDMYDSIDGAIEKANTQLKKHVDKLQEHHKAGKGTDFTT